MGKRSRARAKLSANDARAPESPTGEYTDAEGNMLVLRGSLKVGARREYANTLAGAGAHSQGHNRAAATREANLPWA